MWVRRRVRWKFRYALGQFMVWYGMIRCKRLVTITLLLDYMTILILYLLYTCMYINIDILYVIHIL